MNLTGLKDSLQSLADPAKAQFLQRFFKTGPGQYAAGDQFLGIVVPSQRKIANLYWDVVDLSETIELLSSPYHEYRLVALMILIKKFQKGDSRDQKLIYDLYLSHTKFINNWDLVDLSAPHLVGNYLLNHERSVLLQLARSELLWERRIAIISTLSFIRQHQFIDTLKLARILMTDKHDLIHKAVGWMLREVGKRDETVLLRFLDQYAPRLPRTALRYSLEKLSPDLKKYYLVLK